MKLPASPKVAEFDRRPLIEKGYYPAKLVDVKEFKDKDGNYVEGKFGRQIILDFVIYGKNKKGEPTEPLVEELQREGKGKISKQIVISKFVYHQYKDRKTGEYHTAITANSAITKVCEALGWKFDPEGEVDFDKLKDKEFVEVNIDDFEAKAGDETYTASSIQGVKPFKKKPAKEETTEKKVEEIKDEDIFLEHKEEIQKIEEKKKKIKKDLDEGIITQKGYDMALEQLEEQLLKLKKK